MPTLGELTGFILDPQRDQKQEEIEVRKELMNHKCPRCIVEKRLTKDRLANFKLLTDRQRSIYKETKHKIHRCGAQESRIFKYEICKCMDSGEQHKELSPNVYGSCNIKTCNCRKFTPINV